MPDKDQVFIFSKDELSLIKNTFADNDTLLYTIRKVFLQFPLSEAENGLLKVAMTPEVVRVLKKRMLPDLSPEYPLGQIPSIMTTLTQDLKSKSPEDMELQFEAKKIETAFIQQGFDLLSGKTGKDVKDLLDGTIDRVGGHIQLKDLGILKGDAKQDYIDMTAYLFLLGYIDPSLIMIKTLAGSKEETPEEQEARLRRDSSK